MNQVLGRNGDRAAYIQESWVEFRKMPLHEQIGYGMSLGTMIFAHKIFGAVPQVINKASLVFRRANNKFKYGIPERPPIFLNRGMHEIEPRGIPVIRISPKQIGSFSYDEILGTYYANHPAINKNKVMFVITHEGELIISPTHQFMDNARTVVGKNVHSELAGVVFGDQPGGHGCLVSGEIILREGIPVRIDNVSGHYKPRGLHLGDMTEHFFKKNGIKVKGLFFDVAEQFQCGQLIDILFEEHLNSRHRLGLISKEDIVRQLNDIGCKNIFITDILGNPITKQDYMRLKGGKPLLSREAMTDIIQFLDKECPNKVNMPSSKEIKLGTKTSIITGLAFSYLFMIPEDVQANDTNFCPKDPIPSLGWNLSTPAAATSLFHPQFDASTFEFTEFWPHETWISASPVIPPNQEVGQEPTYGSLPSVGGAFNQQLAEIGLQRLSNLKFHQKPFEIEIKPFSSGLSLQFGSTLAIGAAISRRRHGGNYQYDYSARRTSCFTNSLSSSIGSATCFWCSRCDRCSYSVDY